MRSDKSISYSSFAGEIEFVLPASESERWISAKNSFLAVKLSIIQTDENDNAFSTLRPIINIGSRISPTQLSIPYINSSPLFSPRQR